MIHIKKTISILIAILLTAPLITSAVADGGTFYWDKENEYDWFQGPKGVHSTEPPYLEQVFTNNTDSINFIGETIIFEDIFCWGTGDFSVAWINDNTDWNPSNFDKHTITSTRNSSIKFVPETNLENSKLYWPDSEISFNEETVNWVLKTNSSGENLTTESGVNVIRNTLEYVLRTSNSNTGTTTDCGGIEGQQVLWRNAAEDGTWNMEPWNRQDMFNYSYDHTEELFSYTNRSWKQVVDGELQNWTTVSGLNPNRYAGYSFTYDTFEIQFVQKNNDLDEPIVNYCSLRTDEAQESGYYTSEVHTFPVTYDFDKWQTTVTGTGTYDIDYGTDGNTFPYENLSDVPDSNTLQFNITFTSESQIDDVNISIIPVEISSFDDGTIIFNNITEVSRYHLQLSNTSNFDDIYFNDTNINPTSTNGTWTTVGNNVEFEIDEAITVYGGYARIRAAI